MSDQRFKVGDVVTWTSQAGGSTSTKAGRVAEVVAPNKRPSPELFPALHGYSGCGRGRTHESYVVLVGTKPYWPHAKLLSLGGGLARATVAARDTNA